MPDVGKSAVAEYKVGLIPVDKAAPLIFPQSLSDSHLVAGVQKRATTAQEIPDKRN